MRAEDRFVVAGSGRSGTGFFSRALSALGLPCGHEAVFDHNLETSGLPERWSKPVAYPGHEPYLEELLGDSSLGVVLSLERVPRGARLLHVTRNPLDVVRSWMGTPFFAEACRGRCDPEHEPGAHLRAPYPAAMRDALPNVFVGAWTELDRAIRWTVAANRTLELFGEVAEDQGVAYRRVRLEDVDDELLVEVADWLRPEWLELAPGIGVRARAFLADAGVDVNRHDRGSIDWRTVEASLEGEDLADLAASYGYPTR